MTFVYLMLLNGFCVHYRLCIKWNLLFRFGAKHLSTLPENTTLTQCWSNVGPPSATLAQHKTSTGSTPRVCWDAFSPVNTKHFYNICTMLDQRRRRWDDVVQMLYKCFEFAGNSSWSGIVVYCWWRLQADPYPMSVKCWASVAGAGQYPFSPSQYFMLPVPACWRYGHMLLTKAGLMLARRLWRWPTFSVAPNTTR